VAEEKGLELLTLPAPDLPASVTGDQARFRQILVNLIGNALQFTITGRVTVTAQHLATHDGTLLLRFAVSDTGIGMTAETIQRIFAPFEQADTSSTRQYGGAGLGLTICRRLVTAMGGDIHATSTVGSGSTFTVDLPFRSSTSAAATSPSPASPQVPLRDSLRVLIAEDNQTNSELLQAMLHRLGVTTISCAENGRDAVKLWQRGDIDLILMDVQMPVMDGIEATRFIRTQEIGTGKRTPIIAITAHAMVGDRERILEAGMDSYLKKPFKSQELFKLIQTHAGQDRPAQQSPSRDEPASD